MTPFHFSTDTSQRTSQAFLPMPVMIPYATNATQKEDHHSHTGAIAATHHIYPSPSPSNPNHLVPIYYHPDLTVASHFHSKPRKVTKSRPSMYPSQMSSARGNQMNNMGNVSQDVMRHHGFNQREDPLAMPMSMFQQPYMTMMMGYARHKFHNYVEDANHMFPTQFELTKFYHNWMGPFETKYFRHLAIESDRDMVSSRCPMVLTQKMCILVAFCMDVENRLYYNPTTNPSRSYNYQHKCTGGHFLTKEMPAFSIYTFCKRLALMMNGSITATVSAVVLFWRLHQMHSYLFCCEKSFYRIFSVCYILAIKYTDDFFEKDTFYGNIIMVPNYMILTKLQLLLFSSLNYRLGIDVGEFSVIYERLLSYIPQRQKDIWNPKQGYWNGLITSSSSSSISGINDGGSMDAFSLVNMRENAKRLSLNRLEGMNSENMHRYFPDDY